MPDYEDVRDYLFKLDPEVAHAAIEVILRAAGTFPAILEPLAKQACLVDSRLEQELFGKRFYNPVGLGAGFDKNATMIRGLSALGFGHLELGTVTPKPQSGNPKPRLFRHIKEESIQNAMGFNNDGANAIASRLRRLYPYALPLGINLGKNKLTPQESALKDYELLAREFDGIADYMAINISSPNTPDLRDLQNESFVGELFSSLKEITSAPLLLKIAPDMSVDNALKLGQKAIESGAQGIIATNTTTDHSLVENPQAIGGISGKALRQKSYELFVELGKAFFGKTTLISVGGIDSGKEAYKRLKAGASLVQIYTAMIYEGPMVCQEINEDILECLEEDGYTHLSQAIGADLKA